MWFHSRQEVVEELSNRETAVSACEVIVAELETAVSAREVTATAMAAVCEAAMEEMLEGMIDMSRKGHRDTLELCSQCKEDISSLHLRSRPLQCATPVRAGAHELITSRALHSI